MGLAEIRVLLSAWKVPIFFTTFTGPISRILYTLLTVHALGRTEKSHRCIMRMIVYNVDYANIDTF